jgi:predicted outer membrane repeat protein
MQPTSLAVTSAAPRAVARDAPAAPPLTLAADTRSVRQAQQEDLMRLSRTIQLGTAVLLSMMVAGVCSGRTIHVPHDLSTIGAAVGVAECGDTVLVASGVYQEWGIHVTSGVHLLSETGDPAQTVIDASQEGRILILEEVPSEVVVSGFTLRGGYGGQLTGGALYCRSSATAVQHCVFSENEACHGGAIACWESSTITLQHCLFEANGAAGRGGAAYVRDSSIALISDSIFSDNWADSHGGALRISYWSELSVVGCFLAGNEADHGGGISASGCSAEISQSRFEGNHARNTGAALKLASYWPDLPVTIHDCVFSANTSEYSGGALSAEGAFEPVITDCVFSGNTTEAFGGALHFVAGCVLTLARCTVSANSAGVRGGGVSYAGTDSDPRPVFTECEFTGNTAGVCGGALHIGSCSPVATHCTFAGNSAGSEGGAVRFWGYCWPEFANCTLYDNHAGERASGVMATSHAQVIFENTIIAFGTGAESVRCEGDASITLRSCDVYGNDGGDWVGCISSQGADAGNMWADPLFCLEENPECPLSLHPDSPCIVASSVNPSPIGAWGIGCGSTTVRRASWGAIKASYK